MKYLLLLLGICLLGCKGQSTKQEMISNAEIEIEEGSLTKGEQYSLIMVLSPYLEVDTAYANKSQQDLNKILDEVLNEVWDEPEPDKDYTYHQNILHVDSVIKQCIAYVMQNKPKQLLDLFDKERMNIYGHPSNTIEHERDLHYMILSLYEKYYRSENERLYAVKMVELYEFSLIHIIGLELFRGYYHPDYIPLTKILVDCYAEGLNNYDRAIELQQQICERVEKEDADGRKGEWYLLDILNLSILYDAIGDSFHSDSCYQIYSANPYYQKYMIDGELEDE